MSGITIYQDVRAMTRSELAAELHRVASELDQAGRVSFGKGDTAGQAALPEQVRREFEIERSKDGSGFKLEIEVKWTAPRTAAAGTPAPVSETSATPQETPLDAPPADLAAGEPS